MKEIVALLTCCAMVYHYTVGDCLHAHCQTPPTTAASVAIHEQHHCDHHHGAHQHDAHQHDDGAEEVAHHSEPQVPSDPGCPHDDFHHAHSMATLIAGYQHWDVAKAPVAVLDGAIEIACEQLKSSEPFCRDTAHDYFIRTRGDCYRGLGAFLS